MSDSPRTLILKFTDYRNSQYANIVLALLRVEVFLSRNTKQRKRVVYTVGHSNHSLETFVDLLKDHQIEVLVDTRSSPYSRFAPHFNMNNLKSATAANGMRYVFLGKELGGRPEGDEFYDANGRVDYARVAESSFFLEGISRVEKGIEDYRVALLCSEENPRGCHRHLLVGRVLANRGMSLQHIRGDGSTQMEETQKPADDQLSLFAAQEAVEWKSIQPVSQKRRLRSSSTP